jgi:hypothetical protein
MICLLYLFDDHKVVSIAGYRIYSILYCGKDAVYRTIYQP